MRRPEPRCCGQRIWITRPKGTLQNAHHSRVTGRGVSQQGMAGFAGKSCGSRPLDTRDTGRADPAADLRNSAGPSERPGWALIGRTKPLGFSGCWIIMLLSWSYLTSFAMLFGAEVNAELER